MRERFRCDRPHTAALRGVLRAPAGTTARARACSALAVLSGRDPGSVQPVELHLVMTDRALLGTGNPDRPVMEPARIPGHGGIPAGGPLVAARRGRRVGVAAPAPHRTGRTGTWSPWTPDGAC